MRVELTIRTTAGDRDVAVEASPTTLVATVHRRLVELLDLEPTAVLMVRGRPLDQTAALAGIQLRTGAVLTADRHDRDPPPPPPTGLALRVIGGPCAGTVVPLTRGRFTIGRDPQSDVVLRDGRVSRRHARLDVAANGVLVTDHGSTNGTTLNGVAVNDSAAVDRDDVLRLGDSLLALQSLDLAPAALTVTPEAVLVNRPPRRGTTPTGTREIENSAPIARARPRPVQWGAAVVPALAAGGLAWFTRSPIFLLFGLMSPVIMLSGALGDRLHWRGTRRRRGRAEQRRHSLAQTELAAALHDETQLRRTSAPDPATLLLVAATPASRLWERRGHDPDLLTVRLGVADGPSQLVIRTGSAQRPAGQLLDVPVVVDLRSGPLGVVGPPSAADAVIRWLVVQLAVLHPPGVVDLVLLLSPEVADSWSWARWLPHVAGQVGVDPIRSAALVADLGRRAGRRRSAHDPTVAPDARWTVLVVDRADRLTGIAGLGELLATGLIGGVSAICVAPYRAMLPTACVTVATIDDDVGTRLTLHAGDERIDDVLLDAPSHAWAEQVSRALAPLTDATAAGPRPLPAMCTLSAVLGGELDSAAVARWWGSSSGRPDTPIGLGPEGVLSIDLLRDGPHALIAGTTGAGKSQLLQSLVAGLAVRHPPDEITFLLIDYKGGAAFAECDRLPHTAGIVTDLDPHLTRRALRSLTAELSRRERLFAAVRAADLEAYRAARPPEPVARLVIVVDEFATLATELPEFLHGIVGVARRGRSLGVHLVLATQRPGNAVTPEIRANTSLRIALRVTDPAESTDLIQAADAALIPRDRPGRAVLRCGDRLTPFQTARPVSGTAAELVVEPLGAWRRAQPAGGDEGGLRQIVDAVCAAARTTGHAAARSPWCEPLPDVVTPTGLGPARFDDRLPLALLDLPDNQTRSPLELDLSRPSGVLIAGGPGSGRTTALVTLALAGATARPPDALAIHLIDPAGRLRTSCADLPHVGTAVGPGEAGLVAELLRRLAARTHVTTPTLLLVDGWDRLLADCDDAEALHLGDRLTALLRAAREALVTVVATGDRGLLLPRAAASFDTRLVLRLADQGDYGLVGLARGDVPDRLPPGRGVRSADGAEFQIARADSPAEVVERVRTRWAAHPDDPAALHLRALPRRIALNELARAGPRLVIGLAGAAATPLSFDPFAGARRWLVAGPGGSGKSTTLQTILAEALRVGLHVVVAAPPRSPLALAARAAGTVRIIEPDANDHTTDHTIDIGPVPDVPTLLLVDDSDAFQDTSIGDRLTAWIRADHPHLAVVLTGRCEDLVTAYRGIAAEVRRSRCGILLRPGPIDGELLGLRLGRRRSGREPPGRGVVAGDPLWESDDGEPVPIQIAQPEPHQP